MWIERLNFSGFGKLADTTIEFAPDKLNLVVESNEYGKSTIADALLALLYDFPAHQRASDEKLKDRESHKPLYTNAFKASADLYHQGRSIRVVRDFQDKSLRVFDLSNSDREITQDYLNSANQDELGFMLCGMGRELFQKTCFVGQRQLLDSRFEGDRQLAGLIQSIADSSGGSTTAAEAIGVIEDALSGFPYHGKKLKADRLVASLETERRDLSQKTNKLIEQRESVRHDLERLSQIETSLAQTEKEIKSLEYLDYCLQAADIDARLLKARERLIRLAELRQQEKELSIWKAFPIEKLKTVEELWTKRESRLEDRARLSDDIRAKQKSVEVKDLELRERYEGLSTFTSDEAQTIFGLARTVQSVLQELTDAEKRKEAETKRLNNAGIDLESLNEVRKALFRLDAKDLDDAYGSAAEIKKIKEETAGIERLLWRARLLVSEIEQEQKNKLNSWRNNVLLFCILTFVLTTLATFATVHFHLSVFHPIMILLLLLHAACLAVICIMLVTRPKNFRKEELEAAKQDEAKQAQTAQDLHVVIIQKEAHLAALSRKAGLESGDLLLRYIERYATAAGQFKDLDLLEQIIAGRQNHLTQLNSEIAPFFKRAGKPSDSPSPKEAMALSDAINRFLEEARAMAASKSMVHHQQAEIQFLLDEVRDIDANLAENFRIAQISDPTDPEKGYKEYQQAAASYRQWQQVVSDIRRFEQDTTSELSADRLPELIDRLQIQQGEVWQKLADAVEKYPEIAKLAPPPQDFSPASKLIMLRETQGNLKSEQQELAIHVRSATKEYDDNYLSSMDELESCEQELTNIRRAKFALELARDTFKKLSVETHIHWSAHLNNISRQILDSVQTDFETLQFDPELRMTARKKGVTEPLQPAQITSQLSIGAQEQLFWLARMVLLRFLSNNISLPFILDEPFSEADDERFLRMVRFLINNLLKHHQVIIFSCHYTRHQWLVNQLDAAEREQLQFCRLRK